jgi:enoyl-CoA hydratase/carnithine racemase
MVIEAMHDPADPVLLCERHGDVAQVTLNRPAALNALDSALMAELSRTWRELAADDSLRCVVLTGAGRGFCAGADVTMLEGDRADAAATAAQELAFEPGRHLAVPVIAAVNGVCAGGGLHFVADADIAIAAAAGASFVDPHVSVGHVSALEPLQLMLKMRPDILRRMVLLGLGERLSAEDARSAGLVSEVVEDDRLLERAHELAAAIAEASPAAVRASRKMLRAAEERLLGTLLEEGWQAIRDHWPHPDAAEGPRAMSERRPPRWT